MGNTNKKKIKRNVELICKFFITLGFSASIMYFIKTPESLLTTAVTIVSFLLALIATCITFNERINERLVGMIWQRKYHKQQW